MSTMRRVVFFLLVLSACESPNVKGGPPKRAPESPAAPPTREEVIAPRDDGPINADDYVASETTFRLFGIENGDSSQGRGATIANKRDWSTKTYHRGDLIGRGMRVSRIDDASVDLEAAAGTTRLDVSVDTPVRIIRHRLDVIAEPLGRNYYVVDTEAARAADPRLPSYQAKNVYGVPALQLGPIDEETLFYGCDFREGDLVSAVDGRPVDGGSLRAIAQGLTDGRPQLLVRVIRGGAPADRTYVAKR
jgi:hypothetical protein